jgi:hypothetical protein
MNISTSLHSKIRFFLSCDWCLVCASNICTQRISQRNPFLAAEAYHRNPRRYPRRSMFKKGRYFFSWSPPYFVNCLRFGGFVIRPWKIVPFKFLNFLLWVWDQPIFYKVPPPKKNCRTSANILVLCCSNISMVPARERGSRTKKNLCHQLGSILWFLWVYLVDVL